MTWSDILFNIAISILSSAIFWLLTFVITRTKVIFAEVIEQSMVESCPDGDPMYRIRIMNIGKRNLLEIDYCAKIRILNDPAIGTYTTFYLNLENDVTRPLMYGRGQSQKNRRQKKNTKENYYSSGIFRIVMNEGLRQSLLLSPYIPAAIRREAENGTLTLDDMLKECGEDMEITFYVRGTDSVTGARKVFESHEYTVRDIKPGKYQHWSLAVKHPRLTVFGWKKRMIRAVSNFKTAEEILKDMEPDAAALLPDGASGQVDMEEAGRRRAAVEKMLRIITANEKEGRAKEEMRPYVLRMRSACAKYLNLEDCDRYLRAGTAEEKKQIAQEHREKIRALCEASENGIDAQEQAEVWTWIEEHAGEPDLLKTQAGKMIQSA